MMRVLLISMMIASLASFGFPAWSQTQSEASALTLEEAREALAIAPGSEPARRAFTAAMQKAIGEAWRNGQTDAAYTLNNEYLIQLGLRLSVDPSDTGRRWRRYQALRFKHDIELRHLKQADTALKNLLLAEIDIRFLVNRRPEVQRYKAELVQTLAIIGWNTRAAEDLSVPDGAYDEAIELAREVLVETPDNQHASFAVAYGLWWIAARDASEKQTYEAYEASLPLYEDAALAFKSLTELSAFKGYALDRAQVWYGLGQTYRELGDDEEAFKAYRLSLQLLKETSDEHPQDAVLYRQVYMFSGNIAGLSATPEGKISALEKTKKLLLEAEATGRLHPDDGPLFEEVDRRIAFNTALRDASGIEEILAISNAYTKELEAEGVVVRSGNIDVEVGQ